MHVSYGFARACDINLGALINGAKSLIDLRNENNISD